MRTSNSRGEASGSYDILFSREAFRSDRIAPPNETPTQRCVKM